MTGDTCVCGHGREPHEHYRAGSDCALCGADVCPQYRTKGGVAGRWVARVIAAVRRPGGAGPR